jgi:putative phage-type endonuclease
MTDIIQGSKEWHALRLGRLTASRVADAVAKTKTGWGASRANLMATLIIERLTDTPQESFTSPAMQHGIDTEPQARAAYCFYRDAEVTEVGFVEHPSIPMSGCSPDGLIGDAGMLEIKCPNTATHLETLLDGTIPGKYVTQMQWQMACTGRQWCDFVSFDPRLPESMRLFVQRVPRNNARIEELSGEVIAFLVELNDKLATLRDRYETKAAA